jgi:hypothetical protein
MYLISRRRFSPHVAAAVGASVKLAFQNVIVPEFLFDRGNAGCPTWPMLSVVLRRQCFPSLVFRWHNRDRYPVEREVIERLQFLMKYPYEIRARNSLFCHESEFTVAAPVVDGEAVPASPIKDDPSRVSAFPQSDALFLKSRRRQMAPPRLQEGRW